VIFKTIREKHYSNQFTYKIFNIFNNNRFLSYYVTFSDSCRYELPKEDQEDINKLFGFSLGFNHHKDSARTGWFYKDNNIHIYAYIYDNGIRTSKFIKTININETYIISIVDEGSNWLFSINDVSVEEIHITDVRIDKSSKFKIGYKLWPYFGGNNTAPHDILIDMSLNI